VPLESADRRRAPEPSRSADRPSETVEVKA